MPRSDDPSPGDRSPGSDADPSGSGRPGGPTLPGDGSWFGDLGQLDFDVDFFERLLTRDPDRVEVVRVLGELVSRKGLLGRALELDRHLVALLPRDSLARYNLACSLALTGSDDEAIDSLATAFRLGYDDVAHMEVDPDLASLRGRPEFRALVDRG